MKVSSKALFVILVICTSLVNAFGQSRVRVFRERDKNNEKDYVIYADNPTGKPHHVVVIFDEIVGYVPSIKSPPAVNVDIGRSKLFKLKRDELSSEGNFRYHYYIYPGIANPKIRKVEYAIPTVPNKEVRVRELLPSRGLASQKASDKESYYGLAFKGNPGDTICASRGGRVSKIGSSQNRNFIEVRHLDGTVARYTDFKSNTVLVKEGEDILAGNNLALFSEKSLQLSVRCLRYDYKIGVKNTNWYSFKYLIPTFRIDDNVMELQDNQAYTTILTDKMIIQEMSKRQRKKFLKARKK